MEDPIMYVGPDGTVRQYQPPELSLGKKIMRGIGGFAAGIQDPGFAAKRAQNEQAQLTSALNQGNQQVGQQQWSSGEQGKDRTLRTDLQRDDQAFKGLENTMDRGQQYLRESSQRLFTEGENTKDREAKMALEDKRIAAEAPLISSAIELRRDQGTAAKAMADQRNAGVADRQGVVRREVVASGLKARGVADEQIAAILEDYDAAGGMTQRELEIAGKFATQTRPPGQGININTQPYVQGGAAAPLPKLPPKLN